MEPFYSISAFFYFALAIGVVTAIVHLIFALGVYKDSERHSIAGYEIWPVSGTIWALATLIGGLFVVIIYWLIHHSALRRAHS